MSPWPALPEAAEGGLRPKSRVMHGILSPDRRPAPPKGCYPHESEFEIRVSQTSSGRSPRCRFYRLIVGRAEGSILTQPPEPLPWED